MLVNGTGFQANNSSEPLLKLLAATLSVKNPPKLHLTDYLASHTRIGSYLLYTAVL